MARAELGVKRRCLSCGGAFFDLNREPIVCPKCRVVFEVVELPHSAPRKSLRRPVVSDGPLGDEQMATDDVASAEEDVDTEAVEPDDAEPDDSVIEPMEEDPVDEIEDLI